MLRNVKAKSYHIGKNLTKPDIKSYIDADFIVKGDDNLILFFDSTYWPYELLALLIVIVVVALIHHKAS